MAEPYPPTPGNPDRRFPDRDGFGDERARGWSDTDWGEPPTAEHRQVRGPDGYGPDRNGQATDELSLGGAATEEFFVPAEPTEELGGRHRAELALRAPTGSLAVLGPAEVALRPRSHTPRHRRPFQSRQARFGASSVGLTVAVGLVGTVLILQHSPDGQSTRQNGAGSQRPSVSADGPSPGILGDPTADSALPATPTPSTSPEAAANDAANPAAIPRRGTQVAPRPGASKPPVASASACAAGGGGAVRLEPTPDETGGPGDEEDPDPDDEATPTPDDTPQPSATTPSRPAPSGSCPPA